MWRSLRCLSAALLYVCLARDTCEDGSCQGLKPRVVLFQDWKLLLHAVGSCWSPAGQEPTAMLQARSKIKARIARARMSEAYFQLECWGRNLQALVILRECFLRVHLA